MADEDDEAAADTGEETEDTGFKSLGVVSGCFSYMAYDSKNRRLQMSFNKGGSYLIEGIDSSEVDNWVNSGSPGGYFNSFIRGKY